jgi:phage tail sheath protein FI
MPTLTYPGVYIEEIPSGVHTITGVATSIAAFIGWCDRGPVNQATLVESWQEFQTQFGGLNSGSYLGYAVSQFFGSGSQQAYIVRLVDTSSAKPAATASATIGGTLNLYASSPGDWGDTLQVSVIQMPPVGSATARFSLQIIDGTSGKTLESYANLSIDKTDPQYVVTVIDSDSQYVTFVDPANPTNSIAAPTSSPSSTAIPAPTQVAVTGSVPPPSQLSVTTTYFYVVSALYGNQESAASNEISNAPTATLGYNSVTWNAAPLFNGQSPTGYRIYRGTATKGENVFYTVPGNALTFIDTGASSSNGNPATASTIPAPTLDAVAGSATPTQLTVGIPYYYVVSALYGSQESLASSEVSNTPTAALSCNSITWTAAPPFNGQSLTGYKIYRGTTSGGENAFYTVAGNVLTFLDTGASSSSSTPTTGPSLFSGGHDGSVLTPGDGDFETALLNDPNGNGLPLLDRVPIFNLLCVPGESDPTTIQALQQYCHGKRAFYIVDCPQIATTSFLTANGPSGATSTGMNANSNITGQYSINSAYYFPWVMAPDPLAGNRQRLFPPCGFVASVYAATDAGRGVWKAPAGIEASLTGVSGLQYVLTDLENGNLNTQGINCLRQFRVYGDVVWGARTLQGNDQFASEWKYLSIRRFALFLESSLYDGTQWVVFEPNDEHLWSQIRLNVGAFMQGLFLQGAFQGTTPQQAYFVKCDSENNPQSSIDQGIVNILVGFAPLYPAEFVVIQIQQMAGQV